MDALESYSPQTPLQLGLTATAAAAAVYVLFRRLLKQKQSLKGKVVLITGASSGIGEALAHQFIKAKSKVILAARSIDKLKTLQQELLEQYKCPKEDVASFFLDLEDSSSIREAARSLIQLFGRIDILVNNAGIGCRDKVTNTDMDTYRKVLEINFFGQVALTRELLPQMIENGGGTIAAISSLQGRFALPGGSAYGASKHALQAFCDSLRAENAKKNVHVLVVSPSYVRTNIDVSGITGTGEIKGVARKEIKTGMTAEYCASGIMQAIANRDNELLIGPMQHKLVVYIRALMPSLYTYIMSRL